VYFVCLSFVNWLSIVQGRYSIKLKSILLTLGTMFSVFLGPDEHLPVSECPVAVQSVIGEHHLPAQHQGGYVLLAESKSPDLYQIQPDKM
jgi:hypothetical protein